MAVVNKILGTLYAVPDGELSDTLATNNADLTDAIDPATDLDNETHMDLMFTIAGTWSAGDKIADIYVIRTIDSDEETVDTSGSAVLPQEAFVGSITVVSNTSPYKGLVRDVPVPSGSFKICVHNTDNGAYTDLGCDVQAWEYEIA